MNLSLTSTPENKLYRFLFVALIAVMGILIYIFVSFKAIPIQQPTLDAPVLPENSLDVLMIKPEWAGMTANEVIEKYKQGSIRRKFPQQFLDVPIESIENMAQVGNKAAQTALKLLKDNRFNKDDNRK